jgi:hypothetical protein
VGEIKEQMKKIDTHKAISVATLKKLIKKYQEIGTLKHTAKLFSVSEGWLRKLFIDNNIRYTKKTKHDCNEKFFSLDTPEVMYWAGFIAADGNISKLGDFALSLKISDLGHIEKFKQAVNATASIEILPPQDKIFIAGTKSKTEGTAKIRFRCRQWSKDLARFNIVPNKTKIYQLPQWLIDHPNFKHFIRGYFDGDGWFSHKNGRDKTESKTRKLESVHWGLCGNKSVMEIIREHLIEQCKLVSRPKILQQKNIWKFYFGKKHDVRKIVEYLYEGECVVLDRKYELSKLAITLDDECPILNIDKAVLEEAYSRLKSMKKVAKELNCCVSSICNYMKRLNIKTIENNKKRKYYNK